MSAASGDLNLPRIGRLTVAASAPVDATGKVRKTKDGDVPKQWYAALWNAGSGPRRAKVFAICASGTLATIEAQEVSASGAPATAQAKAICGQGERTLGGGMAQWARRDHGVIAASGPLDSTGITLETDDGDVPAQWYGAAYPGEVASRFTVMAVCERSPR